MIKVQREYKIILFVSTTKQTDETETAHNVRNLKGRDSLIRKVCMETDSRENYAEFYSHEQRKQKPLLTWGETNARS